MKFKTLSKWWSWTEENKQNTNYQWAEKEWGGKIFFELMNEYNNFSWKKLLFFGLSTISVAGWLAKKQLAK